MSVKFEFQENICYVTAKGKLSKADLDKQFQKMYEHKDFSQCSAVLMHDLKSRYIPSTADIKSTASGVRKLIGGFQGKIAIVVDSNVKYGMGRMLETISRDSGIRVFRAEEEAREWLSEDII